jgi:thioredoxin 2
MDHDLVLTCAGCGSRNRVLPERLLQGPSCGQCSRALVEPNRPLELDDRTFHTVIAASTRPVLVDFWASWCGPCRMFAPALERFAQQHGGRVLVAKVNVDEARRVAATHQIRSIPTICVFQGGKETARHVGGLSLPELARLASVAA